MFSTCRQSSRCELNTKLRYIKKTRVGESIGQEQKLFYEEDRNFGEGGITESVFHFDLVQNSQIELQESQNCVHHYPLNGPKGGGGVENVSYDFWFSRYTIIIHNLSMIFIPWGGEERKM